MEKNHTINRSKLQSIWRDLTIASLVWLLLAHILNLWLKGFLELLMPLQLLSGLVAVNLIAWTVYQKQLTRQSKPNIVH